MKLVQTVFLIMFLLAGCASPQHIRVFKSYPATDRDSVIVLYDEPIRGYEVLAENEYYNTSEREVKKWAASLGADAVLVVVSRTHSTSSPAFSVSGQNPERLKLGQGATEKQAFVTAIKYK
jgi:hypothetical protein